MYIKDNWITNIEYSVPSGYEKEVWPRYFISVPLKGDYITSRKGKTLKILRVIHKDKSNEENSGTDNVVNYTPVIELILGQIVI